MGLGVGHSSRRVPPCLIEPRSLVRGTWDEAKDAAAWVGAKLCSGGDVSLGFYLERPSYLSLAVVTCSPNRSKPELTCPGAGLAGAGLAVAGRLP